MIEVSERQLAPDFALNDLSGASIRLSDFRGSKPVLLVFNRGFF